MFSFKPDYERSKQRIEAFWERALLDRPVVQFGLAKPPEERVLLPVSHHANSAERWLDAEYQAGCCQQKQRLDHYRKENANEFACQDLCWRSWGCKDSSQGALFMFEDNGLCAIGGHKEDEKYHHP